jgi:hypothetical protein
MQGLCRYSHVCILARECVCVCMCVCVHAYTHTFTHAHNTETYYMRTTHCLQARTHTTRAYSHTALHSHSSSVRMCTNNTCTHTHTHKHTHQTQNQRTAHQQHLQQTAQKHLSRQFLNLRRQQQRLRACR